MTNLEKITQMVNLQIELNNRTCGKDWLTGVSKNGKAINWTICTVKEVSEMVDCFPWKHWKDVDKGFDIENFKMEVVDVYHFMISGILQVVYNSIDQLPIETPDGGEPKPHTHEEKLKFAIDRTIEILNYDRAEELLPQSVRDEKILGDENFDYVDELYNITCTMLTSILDLENNINRLIFTVIILECGYQFGFNDIYKLYLGKNILNMFRQDNGYAEGTYVKIWDGEEDNVYLASLLDAGILDPEELTSKLNEKYQTVISK